MSLLLYPMRKNRRQAVATDPVAFSDHRDFIDDELLDRGETLPSLTRSVAPGPLFVHRFSRLPAQPGSRLLTLKNFSNAVDLALRRRRVAWGAQQLSVRAARRAPAVVESFREFNRLRLDPRTATCVRRRARREVLFAQRVAGRRGIGKRGVRRSVHSTWSC